MTEALAGALPGRAIRVVADAAYAGKELRGLDAAISWTTRLRKDAALYDLAPPRTGRRGRPRVGAPGCPPWRPSPPPPRSPRSRSPGTGRPPPCGLPP